MNWLFIEKICDNSPDLSLLWEQFQLLQSTQSTSCSYNLQVLSLYPKEYILTIIKGKV